MKQKHFSHAQEEGKKYLAMIQEIHPYSMQNYIKCNQQLGNYFQENNQL